MITGLDHLVCLSPSGPAGTAAYTALFGRTAAHVGARADGVERAVFRLSNMSLEILSTGSAGEAGERISAAIERDGPGLASVVFEVSGIDRYRTELTRRGLSPGPVEDGSAGDGPTGTRRAWRSFRLPDEDCAGVRTFCLEPGGEAEAASPAWAGSEGTISGLDHIVIETADPTRALAHYGARLGLRLALDRSNPQWGTRLIFFKAGDLVVEVMHRLAGGTRPANDRIFGVCWRTEDIDAAHRRLTGAGLSLSPVRAGRKQGTRVFSVKDGTLNVPTIILSQEARPEPA
jgi:catechol 2,3-dioxygenase-like lactoylglutathione lyase family enzyme